VRIPDVSVGHDVISVANAEKRKNYFIELPL
jgi:hypothetical protein